MNSSQLDALLAASACVKAQGYANTAKTSGVDAYKGVANANNTYITNIYFAAKYAAEAAAHAAKAADAAKEATADAVAASLYTEHANGTCDQRSTNSTNSYNTTIATAYRDALLSPPPPAAEKAVAAAKAADATAAANDAAAFAKTAADAVAAATKGRFYGTLV